MRSHPFAHPYIGLGLLDEASIQRDGDTWTADYPDHGEPYLRMTLETGQRQRITLEEFEADGSRCSIAGGEDLAGAILHHGLGALGGEHESRFWKRVSRHAPSVYVDTTAAGDVMTAFVPSIGVGALQIPTVLGAPWREPVPGPIGRRMGMWPDRNVLGARRATLSISFGRAEMPARSQIVCVRDYLVPGILVGEFADAVVAANGPAPSVAWRPILENTPQPGNGRIFETVARYGSTHDGRLIEQYALIPHPDRRERTG